MKKSYLLIGAVIIVLGVFGFFLFGRGPLAPDSLCSDQVRGQVASAESSISAAAKDLADASASLKGTSSQTYLDSLTQLTPTDLLALKSCDTACKLLDRCLTLHPKEGVAASCATEYADYNTRVNSMMMAVAKIQEYEQQSKQAKEDAVEIAKTEELLASNTPPAGTAEDLHQQQLKQTLALRTRTLSSRVVDINRLAKEARLPKPPTTLRVE